VSGDHRAVAFDRVNGMVYVLFGRKPERQCVLAYFDVPVSVMETVAHAQEQSRTLRRLIMDGPFDHVDLRVDPDPTTWREAAQRRRQQAVSPSSDPMADMLAAMSAMVADQPSTPTAAPKRAPKPTATSA
jgi:hypothetical protein